MEEIKQVPYCGPTNCSRHGDLAPSIFVPLIQCVLVSKVAEFCSRLFITSSTGV